MRIAFPVVAALLALITAAHADPIANTDAPCDPEWTAGLFQKPGIEGVVTAIVESTLDGAPGYIVAGEFTEAGGETVSNIARWDGRRWWAIEGGPNGRVELLTYFDSGFGPELYVAGGFSGAGGVTSPSVVRWDGESWLATDSGLTGVVHDLAVFDDGAGPALFAVGAFVTPEHPQVARAAKWDGQSWTILPGFVNGEMTTIAVYDAGAGAGPELYIGGSFTTIGAVQANRIARWDGHAWSPVGQGLGARVRDLTVFDAGDGAGARLFALGDFNAAGGQQASRIATWDGQSWMSAGVSVSGSVQKGIPLSTPDGPRLVVLGEFSMLFDSEILTAPVLWDGERWQAFVEGVNGRINAVLTTDDAEAAIILGGEFTQIGDTPALRVARHTPSGWRQLGSGFNGSILSLVAHDDGSGEKLFLSGGFSSIFDEPFPGFASWDGTRFARVGDGLDMSFSRLGVFDLGDGSRLYAAARIINAEGVPILRLSKWDGQEWEVLAEVNASSSPFYTRMAVVDENAGPMLYTSTSNRIWKWDGVSMAQIPGNLQFVADIKSFPNGGVPSLVVVGNLWPVPGGFQIVAAWDGVQWSPFEGRTDSVPNGTLALLREGDRDVLYFGGPILGGSLPMPVLRWDGVEWNRADEGIGNGVSTLYTAMINGTPALFARKGWTLYRYEKNVWSLGSVSEGGFNSLAVYDEPERGPVMFLGGSLTRIDGTPSINLARRELCDETDCPGDTNADGLVNFADLNTVLSTFGQTGDALPGDINADGVVNFADLNAVLANFGAGCR